MPGGEFHGGVPADEGLMGTGGSIEGVGEYGVSGGEAVRGCFPRLRGSCEGQGEERASDRKKARRPTIQSSTKRLSRARMSPTGKKLRDDVSIDGFGVDRAPTSENQDVGRPFFVVIEVSLKTGATRLGLRFGFASRIQSPCRMGSGWSGARICRRKDRRRSLCERWLRIPGWFRLRRWSPTRLWGRCGSGEST